MATRLSEAQDIIRLLSVDAVEERVAAVLKRLDLRFAAAGQGARLPITRQDLADMVGSTPESVNRALRGLRERGAVETGRGWVRVLRPGAAEVGARPR